MNTDNHKMSRIWFDRMEVSAEAGAKIIDRAIAEMRPLSSMESAELRLMEIEQPIRQRRWREAVIDEGGKPLKTIDNDSSGLRVTNAAGGQRRTLWLYGSIGAENGGVSADDLRQELNAIPNNEEIQLNIHSEGGSYLDAVAMHSMLSRRSGAVHVVIDGLAASGGSVVAMAGKTITMARNAWMMIHEASGSMSGRAGDFESAVERLRNINEAIVGVYLSRWKGTSKELAAAIAAESWYDAPTAVQVGLADYVSDELAVAARLSPQSKFRNVPTELAVAVRAEFFPRRLKAELFLHRATCV